MSFKVSFQSFTGHNEMDADGAPDVVEFDTEEERKAFLLGVNMTSEALDGWLDGSVEVTSILPTDDPSSVNAFVVREARALLIEVAESPHGEATDRILEWVDAGGSVADLIVAARDLCPADSPDVDTHPKVRALMHAVKVVLLG